MAPHETLLKFEYPSSLVTEFETWAVLLRPQQITLGSLVLVSKLNVTNFHELTSEAFAELPQALAGIEKTLTKVLRYEKINYLMLMMVDPQVHFHVLPRYSATRDILGITLPDASWPGPPDLTKGVRLSDESQSIVRSSLQEAWIG